MNQSNYCKKCNNYIIGDYCAQCGEYVLPINADNDIDWFEDVLRSGYRESNKREPLS
jgi:uncharacterized OB-fold protein